MGLLLAHRHHLGKGEDDRIGFLNSPRGHRQGAVALDLGLSSDLIEGQVKGNDEVGWKF